MIINLIHKSCFTCCTFIKINGRFGAPHSSPTAATQQRRGRVHEVVGVRYSPCAATLPPRWVNKSSWANIGLHRAHSVSDQWAHFKRFVTQRSTREFDTPSIHTYALTISEVCRVYSDSHLQSWLKLACNFKVRFRDQTQTGRFRSLILHPGQSGFLPSSFD